MGLIEAGERTVEAAAVLFDKDCTLLDSAAFWPRLAKRRVEELVRLASAPERLVPVVCRAMGVALPDWRPIPKSPLVLGPRRDTVVAVATALYLDGLAWDRALDVVKEAFLAADAETERSDGPEAFPEARPLLEDLRTAGIRVGVLTNDDRERSWQVLRRAGLDDLIEAVAGGDEVSAPKPDPELLHLLCRRLEVAPEDCVVVGDALSDARMAKSAGARLAVGVPTGSATREELEAVADVVVPGLAGIAVAGR